MMSHRNMAMRASHVNPPSKRKRELITRNPITRTASPRIISAFSNNVVLRCSNNLISTSSYLPYGLYGIPAYDICAFMFDHGAYIHFLNSSDRGNIWNRYFRDCSWLYGICDTRAEHVIRSEDAHLHLAYALHAKVFDNK